MSITITGPISWEAIGRWYAGLATDRTVLAPAVAAKLPALLTAARTADDTLAALQRWVAQDIRYVSIALGLGGYQPRTPAEVVASGYGDCKDKATLFIAAANRLGFKAYPVLLNSGGNTERALPAVAQFDHDLAKNQGNPTLRHNFGRLRDRAEGAVASGRTSGHRDTGGRGRYESHTCTPEWQFIPFASPDSGRASSKVGPALQVERRSG